MSRSGTAFAVWRFAMAASLSSSRSHCSHWRATFPEVVSALAAAQGAAIRARWRDRGSGRRRVFFRCVAATDSSGGFAGETPRDAKLRRSSSSSIFSPVRMASRLLSRPLSERRPSTGGIRREIFRQRRKHPLVARDPQTRPGEEVARADRRDAGRHHRQAARPRLPLRRARRDAEDQKLSQRGLRRGRLSLRLEDQGRRLAAPRPLRRRRLAASRRLHFQHRRGGSPGAHEEAGEAHRAARLHGQGARRPEPMECAARRTPGSRSSPSSSSRSATTMSPAAAFATARNCCAGGPTKRPRNARWISSRKSSRTCCGCSNSVRQSPQARQALLQRQQRREQIAVLLHPLQSRFTVEHQRLASPFFATDSTSGQVTGVETVGCGFRAQGIDIHRRLVLVVLAPVDEHLAFAQRLLHPRDDLLRDARAPAAARARARKLSSSRRSSRY